MSRENIFQLLAAAEVRRRTTTPVTKLSDIKRNWHLIDLEGKVLGRAASQIAIWLMGKEKINFAPYLDAGDWVVAVNAEKIGITGGKEEKKFYRWHTGWPGGFRELNFQQMMAKSPQRIIELAVAGMLPENKLREGRMRRLKVYVGEQHPYQDKFNKENG